ncbi:MULTISPECIES: factor H binding protein domain-containing protein [Kingella]|jgi:hypothetical protein|uniref:Factor H binding protein-like C-terminal domain-containing protein n=2 Tax=Kingella TaxID=32257 RepID=A0ABS1BV75_9NEIS|nr:MULTISPECIES: factor H binding protein domain-containing protein [Kingella]MBK0397204.1 hypothetical protein [Kingella bonacorsii]
MVTAKDLTANVDFILSHNPLYELTIDGKTYHYHNKHASVENDPVNLADLGMGYSSRQVVYSVTPATAPDGTIDLDPSKKDTATGVLNAYQRPYSIVFSETLPSYRVAGVPEFSFNPECKANLANKDCLKISKMYTAGYQTPWSAFENFAKGNQKFIYTGEAFTEGAVPEKGAFNYQVAFGLDDDVLTAKGSGSITGINSLGTVTLGEGKLSMISHYTNDLEHAGVINGLATASNGGRKGSYLLNFFGPNAEEVAGTGAVINEDGVTPTQFGFSGAR